MGRPYLPAACALAVALCTPRASADSGWKLGLEPGGAYPLGGPQARALELGIGAELRGAYRFAPGWLELYAAGAAYGFKGRLGQPSVGAFMLGGGARVLLPHTAGRWSPWLAAEALYVHTGALDRPGFAVATGAAFPLGRERAVWLGPFLRFFEVLEPARAGYDTTNAKILVVGLAGELDLSSSERDRDGDGLPDLRDRCPGSAGPASNAGCPVVDTDGDGVLDEQDRCLTKAGPAKNGGCPVVDTDGDGVIDAEDACPAVRGVAALRGCAPPDADSDGVPDATDRCPQQAGTVHGCPDADGDGVVPPEDECPAVAGAREDHGCPRYTNVVVRADRLEIRQKVYFAYNHHELLSKSFPLLDEVAQALSDHPALKVRIEGHTDNTGNPKKNETLSETRAVEVMAYLVSKGLNPARLTAKGFGSKVPLETNRTAAGRERNRRVEFVIVKPEADASPARPSKP